MTLLAQGFAELSPSLSLKVSESVSIMTLLKSWADDVSGPSLLVAVISVGVFL